MKQAFQIAIDGPVAAGKGTTAKLVAKRLGFVYVDSGAIYRALTLYAISRQVDWRDEQAVVELIAKERPQVVLEAPSGKSSDGRLVTVKLNNEDVSWNIRTEEISKAVSPVAQYKAIREYVNGQARQMAASRSVVMEGRDITGVVLPEADLKIYMDATPEERAKRRHRELLIRGEDVSYTQVYNDLMERDKRDMEHNLKIVPNVWVLDTTSMTIDEVAGVIVKRVMSMKESK